MNRYDMIGILRSRSRANAVYQAAVPYSLRNASVGSIGGRVGRTQRSEDADEQHERGRAGEDAGNRQAADLFDRHVPAGDLGGEHPCRRTGTDLPERAPEHSRHQMARLRAQGRTDTDLAPALRDRERRERVQAGGREQQ